MTNTDQILAEILAAAKETHSDACIVHLGHNKIASYSSGEGRQYPHMMSISKLLTTLAALTAIQEGKLALNSPLCNILPEWKDSNKEDITLRHILAHVSGLQNRQSPSHEIYPSIDWVKLALNADLESIPGSTWSYNNKALNLVPEIIRRSTSSSIKEYLDERLLSHLQIEEYEWYCDPAGNYQGMAGICMKPEDLSKIARLLAHSGVWNESSLLSKEILNTALFNEPIEPENGLSLWPIRESGNIVGWEANGSLGQYLAVFPGSKLSAVRIIEPERHKGPEDDFDNFLPLLKKLNYAIR